MAGTLDLIVANPPYYIEKKAVAPGSWNFSKVIVNWWQVKERLLDNSARFPIYEAEMIPALPQSVFYGDSKIKLVKIYKVEVLPPRPLNQGKAMLLKLTKSMGL